MEMVDVEGLAVPLVASDRESTAVELREEVATLKGDAVSRGRLASGFFVGDMQRLCEKFVDRRAREIIAAYDSVLAAAAPVEIVEGPEAAVHSMLRELAVDVQIIEEIFQSNLHRDHLPVRNAMAEAEKRSSDLITARGPVIAKKHSRRERAHTVGPPDHASTGVIGKGSHPLMVFLEGERQERGWLWAAVATLIGLALAILSL